MIGDKLDTEVLESTVRLLIGRGAFVRRRSRSVSDGRAARSENADMSSDKIGHSPIRRKSKVSWARFVLPGIAGA